MATFNVSGQTLVARAAATVSAASTRYAAEMRQAAAVLRTQGDCDAPAWQLGQRVPPHAETALHAVQLHMQAVAAALQDGLSLKHGYAAILKRPLSSPERAHIDDVECWLGALHTFISSSQSLLAQQRCRRGGAVSYLETSAAVLDFVALITTATHDQNMKRIAEFAPRVAANVVWATPYLEHARTVGAVRAIETFQLDTAAAVGSQ